MTRNEIRPGKGLRRAVTGTRFLIYIPVISLFIGSVALVLVGGFETVSAVYRPCDPGAARPRGR
jgi:hypothetical protein